MVAVKLKVVLSIIIGFILAYVAIWIFSFAQIAHGTVLLFPLFVLTCSFAYFLNKEKTPSNLFLLGLNIFAIELLIMPFAIEVYKSTFKPSEAIQFIIGSQNINVDIIAVVSLLLGLVLLVMSYVLKIRVEK